MLRKLLFIFVACSFYALASVLLYDGLEIGASEVRLDAFKSSAAQITAASEITAGASNRVRQVKAETDFGATATTSALLDADLTALLSSLQDSHLPNSISDLLGPLSSDLARFDAILANPNANPIDIDVSTTALHQSLNKILDALQLETEYLRAPIVETTTTIEHQRWMTVIGLLLAISATLCIALKTLPLIFSQSSPEAYQIDGKQLSSFDGRLIFNCQFILQPSTCAKTPEISDPYSYVSLETADDGPSEANIPATAVLTPAPSNDNSTAMAPFNGALASDLARKLGQPLLTHPPRRRQISPRSHSGRTTFRSEPHHGRSVSRPPLRTETDFRFGYPMSNPRRAIEDPRGIPFALIKPAPTPTLIAASRGDPRYSKGIQGGYGALCRLMHGMSISHLDLEASKRYARTGDTSLGDLPARLRETLPDQAA